MPPLCCLTSHLPFSISSTNCTALRCCRKRPDCGGMWTFPIPDVPRTDLWVIMGANPQASQGSLLACPDLLGQIDRIRDAGGRTIVVDPRRTGTAERADEWIPIVPGTDAALLMAVVHVLFAEGLVDLGG